MLQFVHQRASTNIVDERTGAYRHWTRPEAMALSFMRNCHFLWLSCFLQLLFPHPQISAAPTNGALPSQMAKGHKSTKANLKRDTSTLEIK
jgi:hypothetical protein